MNYGRKRGKRSRQEEGMGQRMGYPERLKKALGQIRGDALRGHASAVRVRHDAWCRLLNGRGACNCEPDMTLTCADAVYRIDRQGNTRRLASGRAEK